MRKTLLVFLFSISFVGFAQEQTGVFVGITKSGLANPVDILSFPLEIFDISIGETTNFNEYGVEAGYQFNSKVRASLDFALLNFKQEREITAYQLGLSLGHRLIEQAKISPKLRYKGGTFLYSNETNNWGAYATVDVLASVIYDNITIDLGGNLNYISSYSIGPGIGVGYTFTVSYLIPNTSKK